ncbi:MAG TPA: hypothetical protein VFJ82_13090 [Longimicrobium sp.]|nr:hypothetical protein [Longimicrobium sp.]
MTELLARLRRPAHPDRPGELAKRLEKADRLIDLGWSVAALWAVLRLTVAVRAWRHTPDGELLLLADPLIILALAYGLYRRSRVCGVLLMLMVVVQLRIAYATSGPAAGIPVAFVLGITIAQGLRGVWTYRKELAEARAS